MLEEFGGNYQTNTLKDIVLNKKSFVIIILGIVMFWVTQIGFFAISFSSIDSALSPLKDALRQFNIRQTSEILNYFSTFFLILLVVSCVLPMGLSLIFFFKAINHRKNPKQGTYLTVLKVFLIIFIVSTSISLFYYGITGINVLRAVLDGAILKIGAINILLQILLSIINLVFFILMLAAVGRQKKAQLAQ